MDAFLTVASKREVRRYDARPLAEDSTRRILDAGRVAGSASNRQNRRFVVLGDREAAAEAVYAPDEQVATVLSFGYPERTRNPEARSAQEWISRANRRPFDEVVERR